MDNYKKHLFYPNINESFDTFNQNTKDLLKSIISNQTSEEQSEEHFSNYYFLSKSFERKLSNEIKKIRDIVITSPEKINNILHSKYFHDSMSKNDPTNKVEWVLKLDLENEMTNEGISKLTHMYIRKNINIGNNQFASVYFIFDSKDIKSCYVMCYGKNYYLEKINNWNRMISPNDYRKL